VGSNYPTGIKLSRDSTSEKREKLPTIHRQLPSSPRDLRLSSNELANQTKPSNLRKCRDATRGTRILPDRLLTRGVRFRDLLRVQNVNLRCGFSFPKYRRAFVDIDSPPKVIRNRMTELSFIEPARRRRHRNYIIRE